MKFGLLVEKETRNIGDDIQAYVTKRFLPKVDYYIDRNHIDEFLPIKEEKVATIMNGWFLQYALNWPPSPYIKPLPISMHFTYKDWFWDTTDRAYHLQGYGLNYLKKHEPIGCRDSYTMKLLESKGIKTEYTACMTLTLEPFKNIEKQDYICAVDVSDAVIEQLKKTTNLEVKVITHIVAEDYSELSWDERMGKVEELLKIYQGAKAVVSYRLHCALPCLSLGTSIILLNEEYRNDRFGDYTKYIESCTEEDFLNGKVHYDYENIQTLSEDWKELRDTLIQRCQKFVEENKNKEEIYEDINRNDYKNYVINKSNWLKEACLESYQRYENIKKDKENIEEKIKDEQENIRREKIEDRYTIEYYKKEFEEAVKKMECYKNELELIKTFKK